jgi:hypothetical protein
MATNLEQLGVAESERVLKADIAIQTRDRVPEQHDGDARSGPRVHLMMRQKQNSVQTY